MVRKNRVERSILVLIAFLTLGHFYPPSDECHARLPIKNLFVHSRPFLEHHRCPPLSCMVATSLVWYRRQRDDRLHARYRLRLCCPERVTSLYHVALVGGSAAISAFGPPLGRSHYMGSPNEGLIWPDIDIDDWLTGHRILFERKVFNNVFVTQISPDTMPALVGADFIESTHRSPRSPRFSAES